MAAHEQPPQHPTANNATGNDATGDNPTANGSTGNGRTPHNGTTADTRAEGNHRADQPEWREALAVADEIPAFARPSAKELDTLARACEHPRQLRLLLNAFARHAKTLGDANTSHAGALPADTPSASPLNADTLPTGVSAAQLPYALLCDFVDDSNHDLREWINALTVFADWLGSNKRPPQPLAMLLPYLSCSAEAQASSPMPLPLPHILADMLELYGYDGETEISTEP